MQVYGDAPLDAPNRPPPPPSISKRQVERHLYTMGVMRSNLPLPLPLPLCRSVCVHPYPLADIKGALGTRALLPSVQFCFQFQAVYGVKMAKIIGWRPRLKNPGSAPLLIKFLTTGYCDKSSSNN